MRKDQYKYVCAWQNRIFTKATPLSCAKHLREEVQELIDDLEAGNVKLPEIADCFMLLIGVCNKLGLEYETISYIIDEKMKINKTREWAPTEKGYMKHIKEEDLKLDTCYFCGTEGSGMEEVPAPGGGLRKWCGECEPTFDLFDRADEAYERSIDA